MSHLLPIFCKTARPRAKQKHVTASNLPQSGPAVEAPAEKKVCKQAKKTLELFVLMCQTSWAGHRDREEQLILQEGLAVAPSHPWPEHDDEQDVLPIGMQ